MNGCEDRRGGIRDALRAGSDGVLHGNKVHLQRGLVSIACNLRQTEGSDWNDTGNYGQ